MWSWERWLRCDTRSSSSSSSRSSSPLGIPSMSFYCWSLTASITQILVNSRITASAATGSRTSSATDCRSDEELILLSSSTDLSMLYMLPLSSRLMWSVVATFLLALCWMLETSSKSVSALGPILAVTISSSTLFKSDLRALARYESYPGFSHWCLIGSLSRL